MSASDELRRAIELTRAGRRVEARDLFLKIVEDDQRNEIAWIWLSGLVDSLEDKIIACENALTINPGNEKVRNYLQRLQQQEAEEQLERSRNEAGQLLRKARACLEAGDEMQAMHLAQQVIRIQDGNEEAWLLIAQSTSNLNQRIAALEKASAINPSNSSTRSQLARAHNLRRDPLGVAAQYEQAGNFTEALNVYKQAAAKARDPREFDRIYRQILRIESLQSEKIQFVAPQKSILRLAFGWPLLYFFLVLVQVGLNPFAHPALLLWLGVPLVAVGSFLLAVSEVRSRHFVWERLFSEQGDGSRFARVVTAAAGWILVIFPHLLLLIDSVNRLHVFKIPPVPF